MSAVLQLYEQLAEAPDDKTRARLIAAAFDALEARFPQIGDLATRADQRESELRLLKEIKEVEARIKEVEVRIVQADRQIKVVEAQIREVEARIKEVEAQIKEVDARLQKEMREMEARLQKEMREMEARLQKEIREVDARLEEGLKTLELKIVELDGARRTEMKQIEVNLQRAITAQTRWFIAGMAMLGIIFKLADLLIP